MIILAKASVEDQQRGFDEGVDAYITKPFSTPYLLGRIEAILTQRRNIQMDVIRKLKETGDKDAIAALRILPATAPLCLLLTRLKLVPRTKRLTQTASWHLWRHRFKTEP